MPLVDQNGAQTGGSISFGAFRLSPAERRLQKDGVAVALGGRALDILIALVERSGEVVSKRELAARAWPDVTVDEGSLRFHITALRKALGDGQGGARYVSNVPGRGYCFVAPVSRLSSPARADGEAPLRGQGDLPPRLARMVGRDETVRTISTQLADQRFVTIVGSGGIGKTTVAVSVAHAVLAEFGGVVRFVDLGTIGDATLVASAVASSFGVPVGSNDAFPGLIAFLRDKRMLLVLDCCEHVVEAAAALSERIFLEAQQVHILATSREALRVEGEHVHRLFPLDYPPEDAALTAAEALAFPSVQLFLERMAARTDRPTFSDADARIVANICRKLDGVALAIEFAAGRVPAYGIGGTAALLDDRFALLWQGRRTAPPRHQTLTATLDWSYDLLPDAERATLRRLAVFAGAFGLNAAQAVLTGSDSFTRNAVESLANLVAKSLVTAEIGGPAVAYRLLDTTRAYALEKLRQSGEFDAVARRHAEYYLALFDGAESDWAARPLSEWLSIYARQIDNLRAALDWAFSSVGDSSLGVALTIASGLLLFQLSLLDECRRRFDRALAHLEGPDADPRHKMRLLGLRSCVVSVSTLVDGRNPLSVVLDLADALGDDDHRALALWALSSSHSVRGETQQALVFAKRFRETAEATGDAGYLAMADRMFAVMALNAGELATSLDYTNRALERPTKPVRRAPLIHHHMDQYVIDHSMQMLVLFLQGFTDRSLLVTENYYARAVETGHALSQINLLRSACVIALYVGDIPLAERYIGNLIKVSSGYQLGIAGALGQCFEAMLLIQRGDAAGGLPLLRAATEKYRATRFGVFLPLIVGNLAECLGKVGQGASAMATADEAFEHAQSTGQHWMTPELLRIRGGLKRSTGDIAEAERDFEAAIDMANGHGALFWELRATLDLTQLRLLLGRGPEATDILSAVYGRFSEGFDRADLRSARNLLNTLAPEGAYRLRHPLTPSTNA